MLFNHVKNSHNFWSHDPISQADRNRLNRHDSGIIWFTGLSAAGKTTLACSLEKWLYGRNIRAYVLDGDTIRQGLNVDLGFGRRDRKENIRRTVEVAKLLVDAGLVVLAAFITPFNEDRRYLRRQLHGLKFIEVYLKCDLAECKRRDPKGLYRKAEMGLIPNYTGISAPYEEPESPHLTLDTQAFTVTESMTQLIDFLERTEFLNPSAYCSRAEATPQSPVFGGISGGL